MSIEDKGKGIIKTLLSNLDEKTKANVFDMLLDSGNDDVLNTIDDALDIIKDLRELKCQRRGTYTYETLIDTVSELNYEEKAKVLDCLLGFYGTPDNEFRVALINGLRYIRRNRL